MTASCYFCCCVPLVADLKMLQSTFYSDVVCSDENAINYLKQYGLFSETASLYPGKKSRSTNIHSECGNQMNLYIQKNSTTRVWRTSNELLLSETRMVRLQRS